MVRYIELADVERAIGWLIEAERLMPDAFRAMIGKSDHQIIEELYMHLVNLYAMAKNNPVHVSKLFAFAMQRAPTDKVSKIIEVAERSNMIERIAGTDLYKPKARTEFAE
jgi:P2-related tail formation protein